MDSKILYLKMKGTQRRKIGITTHKKYGMSCYMISIG